MSANTSTPIHPVLSNRRSPRSFDSTATISNEALVAILEAARWAPSANNFQPWRFHVGVRGDEVFNSVLATLVPFNQSWANRASALVLVSIINQNEDGTPRAISGFDAGLAVSQLTFEAHSRDQVAHQMAGFDAAKVAETFALPSELAPIVVIAIGTQGPAEQLEGVLLERENAPRQRKELSEIVLAGLPNKQTD
jgi:nitroreductase